MKDETKCYCGHTTYCDCGPKEEPKQVWKQIIETCGGKEAFMESAGLKPKQETDWEFERSSGFAGYRNKITGEWVYKEYYFNNIISKEEPKQETLEEVAEKYRLSKKGFVTKYDCKVGFIDGYKLAQERSYSEEEVLKSTDYLGFKQIKSEELNSLPYQPFINDEDGNVWIIDKEEYLNNLKNNKL